jgi:hypothetical protein
MGANPPWCGSNVVEYERGVGTIGNHQIVKGFEKYS